MAKVCIIMGVSGTGKSTIGKLLSEKLGVPFYDGDDFHPPGNIEKMTSGTPLTDADRYDWLIALNRLALEHRETGAVIACSALKASYRDILRTEIPESMQFIHLEGSFELVKSRMENRSSHFMPSALLKSQFDTLEPPKDAISIAISKDPESILKDILEQMNN